MPVTALTGTAAAGAEALDLPGFRRRDVVRTAPHLPHESLLLHLAAELAQGLLELLRILDDYSHNPSRIQAAGDGRYSRTSGRTVLTTATAANTSAKTPMTASAWFMSTAARGAANAGRERWVGSITYLSVSA